MIRASTIGNIRVIKGLKRAPTIGNIRVIKGLKRAPVLKPIGNCLLVGYSLGELPVQNWNLERAFYILESGKKDKYLKSSPDRWFVVRHVVSAVRDEYSIVIEGLAITKRSCKKTVFLLNG